MEKLKGVFTALVTPFYKNGEIDEKTLKKLVNSQIESGISGLVPCGTTGESPTLSHNEHNQVIDIVLQESGGRIPVIAGTGSNSTEEAIKLTEHARKAGANYSLQVAPYYNKPTQKGFYEHFIKIAEEVQIPIIIYNIAGRTAKNIETDTIIRLSEHPNIVGVKEASGSIPQMMDVIGQVPEDFTVLSGDDNLTVPLVSIGGDGVISVASNIVPKQVVEMVDSALKGDFDKAKNIHYKLLPLFKAVFFETNPIPVKYMFSKIFNCDNFLRLPMTRLSSNYESDIDKTLESLNIL